MFGWMMSEVGPVVEWACCRRWPIAVLFPVRKCGLCGEVPKPV